MPLESSSSFRRGGLRDDRRRRLLTDDLSDPDGNKNCRVWSEDAAPRKMEYYENADFLEQQWQLLDLVPRRLLMFALLLTAGAGIIAGLEVAYAWMLENAAAKSAVATAFDIGVKGSLACWFSSLLLVAASIAALLVYTVRRHRTDDYQGRYRVWRWAAGCWFLLATDQAASLREGFRDAMIALTGTPLLGNGTLWWVVVYLLIFGAVGSRLLLDMRPSRLSITALALAGVSYGIALTSHLGWSMAATAAGAVMVRVGSEMAGNLLLLAAMGVHARYVILDAQGLILHPEPRKVDKRKEDAEDESEDEGELDNEVKVISAAKERWRAVDPPHPTPQPAFQRSATVSASAAPFASATIESPVNRKLTKGERKALKDRLLRERREREERA